MLSTKKKMTAAFALTFAGALALSACSSDASTDEEMDPNTPMEEESEAPMDEGMEEDTMDPAANLIGPACADYASMVPDGAGSVEGMAQDPVATAASNNPLLTTLVSAVSGELNPDVNLVDTLNGGEFTVFAPVDDAFAALDQATLDAVATDADLLTTVLTYHVVEGQMTPDEIAGTTQTTLQGGDVEVSGEGDSMMINDANVLCGGVQTANATVYLIDSVLMPEM